MSVGRATLHQIAGARDSLLIGGPIHCQSEAVRGGFQRAQSGLLPVGQAVIRRRQRN